MDAERDVVGRIGASQLLCGDQDSLISGSRRWWGALKEQKMPHHEYAEVKGADHGSIIGSGIPKLFEFL
jgi:hypothetical protein